MLVAALGMMGGSGCSSVDEIYYVSAENPDSDVTLYYRVHIKGSALGGKTKYSAGFYDRSAVERLFAENTLEREYLSTKLDLFDAQTGQRLAELGDQLARSEAASERMQRSYAISAHAAVGELLGRYESTLSTRPKQEREFAKVMLQAHEVWKDAGIELGLIERKDTTKKTPDVDAALSLLRHVRGLLETIRIAVDGRVLVRHFDGAGNEIDTNQKTLVIFVATDVSRFAEAIRQLAESEETTQAVIDIVLGPRIARAQRLDEERRRALREREAEARYMDDTLTDLGQAPSQDELKRAISSFAQVVSGRAGEFSTAAEIRAFAEGME